MALGAYFFNLACCLHIRYTKQVWLTGIQYTVYICHVVRCWDMPTIQGICCSGGTPFACRVCELLMVIILWESRGEWVPTIFVLETRGDNV